LAKTKTYQEKSRIGITNWARDISLLVKLRLNLVVVFTAVSAFIIASQGDFSWPSVAFLAIGGFLVTGAANALNQVLEKDFDKLMERTADRPVAAGRMKVSEAVMAAGFMCLAGVSILALFNPLTALLGMSALVSYAFVYTPLKRHSTVAVFVGAIPGALPMAIGCVAFDGGVTRLALLLFTIQFLWQFPHFWAIAKLGLEDYQKAGFKFLPLKNGNLDNNITWMGFAMTILLILVGPLMLNLGMITMVSAILVSLTGITFAIPAFRFAIKMERKEALVLMFSSFFYLPIILTIFLTEIWI
jgi:protoheme IX farnesyltransferase